MTNKKLSERIKIDDEMEIVTIDGCRFSDCALDFFTTPSRPGQWFRFTKVENGLVHIETKFEDSK